MSKKFLMYWLSILLLLLSIISQTAWSADRVALVIGNASYPNDALANPVNDATDMADALRELDFDVIEEKNLSRKGMLRSFKEFQKKLGEDTEIAFMFYAGHGAQHNRESYLIPTDANISFADDLPDYAIKANNILSRMTGSGSKVSVMVLDACRNLPFKRSVRSSIRGLARIKTNTSGSSLIAYSTALGDTAADGDGLNSPYTRVLLDKIKKPNVSLTDLFNNVNWAVKNNTNGVQTPWMDISPMPKIFLAGNSHPAPTPSTDSGSSKTRDSNCINGNCVNGFGTFYWKNGDKYVGNFVNDSKSGQGTYYWRNGTKYVGDFVNGKRSGKGTLYWKRIRKHVGKMKIGKQIKQGTSYGMNHYEYVGDFIDENRTGQGILYWKFGTYLDERGNLSDPKRGTVHSYKKKKYIGDFVNGKMTGQGSLYLGGGDKYIGNFIDGQYTGQGTFYSHNGSTLIAKFKNGASIKGTGKLYNSKGKLSKDRIRLSSLPRHKWTIDKLKCKTISAY